MIRLKHRFKVKHDMKIGEVAKAAGITASRIRFYERHGIIAPAARNQNGYRDYSPDIVDRLKMIDLSQRLGFSLREIIAVEPAEDGRLVSCATAIKLLREKLLSVDKLIAEATQQKQMIQSQIHELETRNR